MKNDRVPYFNARIELFGDTEKLATELYQLSEELSVDREILMESRDNLLGLHDLCHELLRYIKEKK